MEHMSLIGAMQCNGLKPNRVGLTGVLGFHMFERY